MVNKVMETKTLKLQRQIRTLPRRMPDTTPELSLDTKVRPIPARLSAAAVVAPRQPNSELMKGYKHRAQSLLRTDKTVTFSPNRMCVLKLLAQMKDLFDACQSFTVLDTRVHKARVFFNPQRTAYVMLYENYGRGLVQRSLPHADKKELLDKFRADALVWVEIAFQSSG